MKIQVASISAGIAPPSNENGRNDGDFKAALDAAMNTKAGDSALARPMTAAEKARKAEEADAAAREEFLTYMKKTPMQRMREAILKEMGLTEEDLKAMEPEKRAAAEAAIAEKIKERMLMQAQEKANEAAQKVALIG